MQEVVKQPTVRFPWLFGARVDLCFFYGSIVFGALLITSHQVFSVGTSFWGVVLLNAFGAGPIHQGASWFAYFDKNNRAEFTSTLTDRLIFVFGPILVFLFTILTTLYVLPLAVAIFFIWSLQHIVAQNIGILLLYHNHNEQEARVDRSLEVQTQWFAASMFALIFVYRALFDSARLELLSGHPQVRISPFVTGVVWLSQLTPVIALVGIVTAFLIMRYVYELTIQVEKGRYLNWPALMFWMYSIAALSPLAFVGKTFEEANLIPSTVHWFQYIALNSVLVKAKYTADRVNALPLPRPFLVFTLVCLSAVCLNMGISLTGVALVKDPRIQLVFIAVVMGLGNVHYYLDAFLWRFRDKRRREAVLPYLLSAKSA